VVAVLVVGVGCAARADEWGKDRTLFTQKRAKLKFFIFSCFFWIFAFFCICSFVAVYVNSVVYTKKLTQTTGSWVVPKRKSAQEQGEVFVFLGIRAG
jgi:hypothetical protein